MHGLPTQSIHSIPVIEDDAQVGRRGDSVISNFVAEKIDELVTVCGNPPNCARGIREFYCNTLIASRFPVSLRNRFISSVNTAWELLPGLLQLIMIRVADPELSVPYDFGPPGSGSGSISQRYGSGSRILLSSSKKCRKNLNSYCFCDFFFWLLSLKKDVNVYSKSN